VLLCEFYPILNLNFIKINEITVVLIKVLRILLKRSVFNWFVSFLALANIKIQIFTNETTTKINLVISLPDDLKFRLLPNKNGEWNGDRSNRYAASGS